MPELTEDTTETTTTETPTEDSIEVPVKKESKPKKAKKIVKTKTETETKADKPKKAAKPSTNGEHKATGPNIQPLVLSRLNEGSTRARLFKALRKFNKGLTPAEIKERTGMAENSGHLAVLLKEECEKQRIKRRTEDEDGKDVTKYFLTAKGLKAVEDNTVDSRMSGNRIGKKWTKARKEFEAGSTDKKPPKKK